MSNAKALDLAMELPFTGANCSKSSRIQVARMVRVRWGWDRDWRITVSHLAKIHARVLGGKRLPDAWPELGVHNLHLAHRAFHRGRNEAEAQDVNTDTYNNNRNEGRALQGDGTCKHLYTPPLSPLLVEALTWDTFSGLVAA